MPQVILISPGYVTKSSLIGLNCTSSTVMLWVSCFLAAPVLLAILLYTVAESLLGVEMLPTHENSLSCHQAEYFWVIFIQQFSYLAKYLTVAVSMFCPLDRDYYIGVFSLLAFIHACRLLSVCLRLPFFSLRTNVRSVAYTSYDLLTTLGLLGLPFVPASVHSILPVSIILYFHFSLRLPQTLVLWLLQLLVRPSKSTREAKPERLILFTSLLSYYRQRLSDFGQVEVDKEIGPLLLALVGIMAHHCLPNCYVEVYD